MADQAMNQTRKLPGPERAAVLLMSLGEEAAAEVMRYLSPKEVQKVGAAMATLGSVSRMQMNMVLEDFSQSVEESTSLGVGADDYLRKVLTNALGETKAESLISRIFHGGSGTGIESLKWMDARAVAELIRLEHPQIIAIVLSHLEPDHAAETLAFMPKNLVGDILMRIATLDVIQPDALAELDEILERQFAGSQQVRTTGNSGVKGAADILNFLESSLEESALEEIGQIDAELATKIQDSMFVFDNLIDLDDRSIQALLRETETEMLLVALKGADVEMREKILKNMSKRAAETLREDLEARGPVRVSEVETAQKEILAIARRMAEAGEIALGGGGGDEFV
jgi:flagellar motor switch protein FliG